MNKIFLEVINMSLSASWLVVAVLVLRFVLEKAPKWLNVLLWGIVAVRLICPLSIESPVSLIPDTIGNGEIVSEWADDYIGEVSIIHDNSEYYKAAVAAGREPISDGNGGYYVVTQLDHFGEPSTVKNTVIPVLAIIWVSGVILMTIYTVISYWSLHRKVDSAVLYQNNIFQSENAGSPFVLGIINPRIYLPFKLDGQDLEHVIAHEQAHIRRKDHWWKPLGFLLLTIHWFNPLMWLAYVLLSRDIEFACDEMVIRELDYEQRADYTQALVTCSVNRRIIAACPLAFGEVSIKDRVRSVMDYKKPTFWLILVSLIVCVAVAVCFLTNPPEDNGPKYSEDRYSLVIGTTGVKEIQISLPDSSGGVINADGSFFSEGEAVYLESLHNMVDLRGLTIKAIGEGGEILYALSIPEEASVDEIIDIVERDSWLVAPSNVDLADEISAIIKDSDVELVTEEYHFLQEVNIKYADGNTAQIKYSYPENANAMLKDYTGCVYFENEQEVRSEEYVRDEKDNIISVNNGSSTTTFDLTYDENDRIIKKVASVDGVEKGYETFIYDSQGLVTEIAEYEKSNLVQRTVTEYDENGRRTKITRYDGAGNVAGYDVCEFDQKKYKEKVTQYDANGTLLGYLSNAYDSYFLVLVEEAYDADNHLISTTYRRYVTNKLTYDAAKGRPK